MNHPFLKVGDYVKINYDGRLYGMKKSNILLITQ